ncbi:hypothetical protein M9H77_17847 [Catharanthus roseus]|uniref:Uncharacterized protein n=1 Tax=Catharanthus roseus TaxID=4058 RepID=A0ACC0B5S4_CATRO|nr:hypothetical protein M9H77_17847 [Catharanthus roseus]
MELLSKKNEVQELKTLIQDFGLKFGDSKDEFGRRSGFQWEKRYFPLMVHLTVNSRVLAKKGLEAFDLPCTAGRDLPSVSFPRLCEYDLMWERLSGPVLNDG